MTIETVDSASGQVTLVSNNTNGDDILQISDNMFNWSSITILPRTLMKGTAGMKDAGTTFLPQQVMESNTGYARRLSRSTLLNAFSKTCSFLGGQVFQSDIVFDESVSQEFTEWGRNIDSRGNNINVFFKRLFMNGLAKGVSIILVDVPKKDESIRTKAEEKAANVRPYLREVAPESVLGFQVGEDGSLQQVRIAETVEKPHGKYGTKTVKRIRVLSVGSWELFEEGTSGMDLVDSGLFSVKKIPLLAFIPGEELSSLTGQSPLIDLAELNAKHWRTSSDQDNILSVARVPLLFGKKLDIKDGVASSGSLIISDDDGADLKYVEITGNAIKAGRDDVKDVEASMALYGLQQLVPRTGDITATEKALTSAESNSSLGTWAGEFEDVAAAALSLAGEFVGLAFPDQGISLNKEYNFGVANTAELETILKSHDQGIISAQGVFSEFRRRGTFDEHGSWEENKDELLEDNRTNTALGSLAGTLLGNTE